MTPKNLQFRPYARLLTMLGDQLIKNERIALIEILKNSYDADASWVRVTFDGFGDNFEHKTGAKIIIEDDGVGMTEEVIVNHWVNPATPLKKIGKVSNDETVKGRKIQGEKGIGRFAILKLGKKVTITTRPKKSNLEYELKLDFSAFDDDFLKENGRENVKFLDELNIDFSESDQPRFMQAKEITLGARKFKRKPQGTRIEISHLKGVWSTKKVEEVYKDLVRLQSIFDDQPEDEFETSSSTAFKVFIYQGDHYKNLSDQYLSNLQTLIKENSVFRIEKGIYNESSKEFVFSLNGQEKRLPLMDPEISGMRIFRERFGDGAEELLLRGTKCGSFSFGFYIFDFSSDAKGRYELDKSDKSIIKEHRIYLYRDNIRVYPYGDPEDDWLQIDAYRGTISAGQFLSNDQVVGFVNITQSENPQLTDKTNREGLIDTGNPTSDFLCLIKLFLAWVRKKPYAQYRASVAVKNEVEIFKKNQVTEGIQSLEKIVEDSKPAKEALSEISKLYKAERNYLVKRAETTEHLAGVGLSVETASHDIMAVMGRLLAINDGLIRETNGRGEVNKEVINRELTTMRGMLSFVESQLKDLQLLFKSTKQRRKDIRVREVIEKVHRLFAGVLSKQNIGFDILEKGSPLVAKTTDAVLLQLLLNLFDNSIYWLQTKHDGKRKIEVLLDGDESCFVFSDNGPGIKSDDAPYIFEPFYSGRGEEGRGLGLYIARQLLDRHDYAIDLADIKSQKILPGANFVVSFVKDDK
ncbi:MAG: histidine kinase, gyrase and HSP90-like ATPase family protein [Verrucomicrobiaceae bacterium]|nr:histidine kinase, gyrase and HSP90-like ATPase family protein [Verrucomicrobiaceae bacterium]